jgi:uncharacterized protein (DUF1778 family)
MRNESARLEARLPNAVQALLKRAAACRTVEQNETVRVAVEDQRQIAEAILNPPPPGAALKRAFQRRRELLGAK